MAATPLTANSPLPVPAGPNAMANRVRYPLAPGVHIFTGSICAVNAAGQLVPAIAAASPTLTAVGIAVKEYDNSATGPNGLNGLNGTYAEVVRGLFKVNNNSNSPVAQANCEALVYCADDNSVQTGSGSAIKAGIFKGLDPVDSKPWVQIVGAMST